MHYKQYLPEKESPQVPNLEQASPDMEVGTIGAVGSLDNGAISARCEVLPGGIIYKRSIKTSGVNNNNHGRGEIKGFSKKSKSRLIRKMMRLDLEKLIVGKHEEMLPGAFITLTYPSDYAQDWREWKKHLRAFQMRIDRQLGKVNCIWKLEFQERGAPHFHLIAEFQKPINITYLRSMLSLMWYEVVSSGDKEHLKRGVHVNRIYGPVSKLMRYMTKYMAKAYITEVVTGRIWGVWGDITEGSAEIIHVDSVEFQRRVRKFGRKSPYLRNIKHSYGFVVFGVTEDLLRGIELPPPRETKFPRAGNEHGNFWRSWEDV